MSAKEIQEVVDREKPWFDLARMVLTALGFAIACFIGAKSLFEKKTSLFTFVLDILPLVGPIVFACFLIIRIVVLINRIVDIYVPQIYHGQESRITKAFGLLILFFVLYSANGLVTLVGAALSHQ
jgi:hypothetical protein